VAVGSALGRFTTPLLAGLAAGVTGFVMLYVAGDALTSEPQFRLLALGAATITMVGKAYNPGYLGGQAITFALTSLLFLLLPLRTRSGHNIPTLRGAGVALVAVAAIAVGPSVFPAKREVDRPQPPDWCEGNMPQVCLYYEHRRYADLINPQVRALSEAGLNAGYPAFVPERVVENSRTFQATGPGVRPLWLPASAYEEGRLPLEDVAYHLLAPSHCKWLYDPSSAEVDAAKYDTRFFSLLATWLHLAGRDLDHAPGPYKILSAQEVDQILEEFGRCDLDGRT
jgi:hypothetical protein